MRTQHQWVKPRWLRRWVMCNRCGLVALRNARSAWCAQHGCDYDEHPQYAAMMRYFDQQSAAAQSPSTSRS